jgi:hypothetical protein
MCRSWRWRWAILGVTFMLVGYVRPEMYVAFLLCLFGGLGVAGWQWARRAVPAREMALPLLVIAGTTALLAWRVGLPLGQRSFLAFGQHYAGKVARAQHHVSPLAAEIRWEELVAADFGPVHSIGAALRSNPIAFRWHVRTNLEQTPRTLNTLLASTLTLPARGTLAFQGLLACFAGLGAVGVLWYLCRRGDSLSAPPGFSTGVLLLTLVLIPCGAASLVIFPRDHYLMPVECIGLALLVAGLPLVPGLRRLRGGMDRLPVLVVVLAALFAVTPNRAHGWDLGAYIHLTPERTVESGYGSQKTIVATMKRLPLKEPIKFLDYTLYCRPMYAGQPTSFVRLPCAGDEPFWSFVRDSGATVIVLDWFLAVDPQFARDPEFQDFALGRTPPEFVRFNVPGSSAQIVVRRDVLMEGPTAAELAAEPEDPLLAVFRGELTARYRELNQPSAAKAIGH